MSSLTNKTTVVSTEKMPRVMGNNTLAMEDTIAIQKKPILMYTIIDYGISQKIQLINYVNDIKIIYNEFKNNLTKKAFLIIKKNMKKNMKENKKW